MRFALPVITTALLYATSCAAAPRNVPAPAPAGATVTTRTDGTPATTVGFDTAGIHRLAVASAPGVPLQLTFTWAMQDRDFKFSGKGIVRMEGPDHARLDLFGIQDIQVLRAALNGDSLTLVYAGPQVPIPPVPFLWAVMGVFRGPVSGPPARYTVNGASIDFGYDHSGEHWRFRADSTTLRSVEWLGEDGGRRTVELTGPFRFNRPSKAVFRDWRDFRELTLTVTAVEKVEPFATEIWNVSNR